MSDELERRLGAAAPPSNARIDVAAAWNKGRRQRAVRRGVGAVAVLAILVAGALGVRATFGPDRPVQPIEEEKEKERRSSLQLALILDGVVQVIEPRTNRGDIVTSAGSGTVLDVAWSADGSRLFYSLLTGDNASPPARIFSVSPSGGKPEQITNSNAQDAEVAVSPDGSKIAFVRRSPEGTEIIGTRSELFVRELTRGRKEKVELGDIYGPSSPSWSPDGKAFVFTAVAAESVGLYVAAPRRGVWTVNAVSGAAPAVSPRWSPNSNDIVFVRPETSFGGATDVFLVDMGTGELTRLTRGRRANLPRWTDDARHVVFAEKLHPRGPASKATIQAVDVRTGEIQKLTGRYPDLTGYDVRGSIENR